MAQPSKRLMVFERKSNWTALTITFFCQKRFDVCTLLISIAFELSLELERIEEGCCSEINSAVM
jgi:hypothetical protein